MTNRLRSVLHPDSGRSSRVRRVILMIFISFSLGESVCDVLASRMASATPAPYLHGSYGGRARRPCSISRFACWRAQTAMVITSREHGRPKTSTGEHSAVTRKQRGARGHGGRGRGTPHAV